MNKSLFTKEYNRLRIILVEARTSAGLTQAELSAKLGHPQSYVSKYERGERRLDVIEFIAVMHALGCDPCAILRRVIESPQPSTKVRKNLHS